MKQCEIVVKADRRKNIDVLALIFWELLKGSRLRDKHAHGYINIGIIIKFF